MTVSGHCAKIKTLANPLVDVGQQISNENLVLTLLRGLNDSFGHLRSLLPIQVSFHMFQQTPSALILEESQKKTDAKNAASTALWARENISLPYSGDASPSGYKGASSSSSSSTPPSGYGAPLRRVTVADAVAPHTTSQLPPWQWWWPRRSWSGSRQPLAVQSLDQRSHTGQHLATGTIGAGALAAVAA